MQQGKESRIFGGMEGCRLTEDQTRLNFEMNTVDVGEGVPVDEILETVHHFRAIDYMIDMAEEELTEDIINYHCVSLSIT